MHKHFADWYRTISIDPKSEELQKRWQGVEAFSKELSVDQMAELARIFFGLTARNSEFAEPFRNAFKAVDDSFSMKGNDAELRVLAGATLVDLFRFDSDWGSGSALMIVATACQGLRNPAVPDILSLAQEFLVTTSAELRKGSSHLPAAQQFGEQADALKTAFSQNDIATLSKPILAFAQSITKSVDELRTWAQSMEREQKLRAEESNVLWWVFGNTSRDLNRAFAALPSAALPLIAGKELADLVEVLPGPLAAPALLATIMRQRDQPAQTNKLSLKDAVNGADLQWRRTATGRTAFASVGDLCPVHLAIQKSVEMDGKKAWQTVFETATGIRTMIKFLPVDLAVQAYQEQLVMGLAEKLK